MYEMSDCSNMMFFSDMDMPMFTSDMPPPRSLEHIQLVPELAHRKESDVALEFDGTTVLCRVCGDKASGFHYGVHSCEGCKGFFRRSIQQKIQYRPCTKNQQCSILRINRNRCQYCRLKKCIAVGMSRDAVRFGRVPKREKAKILAAMQKSSNARTQEQALTAELDDEMKLMATVVRAHMETCEFTSDKVDPMIARSRERPNYALCASSMQACPLNPTSHGHEVVQDFSARFSPAIRGVVDFAKRIPGFSILSQDDQVTLLKAAVFEVLLVRLACMYDLQTNSMMCLNGQQIRKDSVNNSCNARFLLDSMFDFSAGFNRLRLTDPEIGLFCSVIVISPDRPGLRNVELLERMQIKLKNCLHSSLAHNHPEASDLFDELLRRIPDLRTLNALHSEKLLAYKMTEQQERMAAAAASQPPAENIPKPQPLPNMWDVAAPWRHIKEELMYEERVKSPIGSVSSSGSDGSMCSGEVAKITELAGQFRMCPRALQAMAAMSPKRKHEHSDSGSDGDETSSLDSPKSRKLDSPTDSGIGDSGSDKQMSPPLSECSSPRSSNDEKNVDIIEDMPVLKRALQAPPLYDTNLLMDEAYKPHKKFRALRKETPEPEPLPAVHSQHQSGASLIASHVYNNTNSTKSSVLSAALMAPALSATPVSLSTTHSTLAKSLMEGPKMSEEQRKRTDILHTIIMKSESGNNRDYHSILMKSEPTDYFQPQQQQVTSHLQQQLQKPPAPVWPLLPPSPPNRAYGPIKMLETQPLNLSKKTPPPQTHISLEA